MNGDDSLMDVEGERRLAARRESASAGRRDQDADAELLLAELRALREVVVELRIRMARWTGGLLVAATVGLSVLGWALTKLQMWWHSPEAVVGLLVLLQALGGAWVALLCYVTRGHMRRLDRALAELAELAERVARLEGPE